jgi:transposase-like protein
MPMMYSQEFKQAAVEKLLARGSRSIDEVREELGISKASVTRWISEFGKIPALMNQEVKGKRSQEYGPEQKLEAVTEYRRLKGDLQAQGEFLRKQGLHGATVESWEKEMLGVLERRGQKPRRSPEEREKDDKIQRLEREIRRKDKVLAETTALLVLKKKAELIWGLVDDEESA